MRHSWVAPLVCLLVAAACGDEDPRGSNDAAIGADAAGSFDAQPADTGRADAADAGADDFGTADDTGTADDLGTADDTGTADDVGTADDAGTFEDTGAPDTSTPDTSTPDTSTPDASAPDASTPDAAARTPLSGNCIRNGLNTCSSDKECFVGGCGNENCGEEGAITLCDCTAPAASCGCVNNVCTWYQ